MHTAFFPTPCCLPLAAELSAPRQPAEILLQVFPAVFVARSRFPFPFPDRDTPAQPRRYFRCCLLRDGPTGELQSHRYSRRRLAETPADERCPEETNQSVP